MLAAVGEGSSGFVIAASAATGVATYLVARRKGSGGVRTSEASDLWEAMREFQERQAAEIRRLEESEAACAGRCEELSRRLSALSRDHLELQRRHDALVQRVERVARLHPGLGLEAAS